MFSWFLCRILIKLTDCGALLYFRILLGWCFGKEDWEAIAEVLHNICKLLLKRGILKMQFTGAKKNMP
jgi:hypothetical protein